MMPKIHNDKKRAEDIMVRAGWLAETDSRFAKSVLGNCQLRSIERGRNVYNEGDETTGLYGLVDGSLKILVSPATDGPMIGHIAQPGQWIGEYAFITGQVRLIGVMAAAPKVNLLYLPGSLLERLLAQTPEYWRWIALLTAVNERLAISIAANLLIRDPHQRLCKLLITMAGDAAFSDTPSTIYCSHEELAEMSNLSRVTVANILRKLGSAGLIKSSYGQIAIRDPGKFLKDINA